MKHLNKPNFLHRVYFLFDIFIFYIIKEMIILVKPQETLQIDNFIDE